MRHDEPRRWTRSVARSARAECVAADASPVRSPPEAQRNAGRSYRVAPTPDYASLHPGYETRATRLPIHDVKQRSLLRSRAVVVPRFSISLIACFVSSCLRAWLVSFLLSLLSFLSRLFSFPRPRGGWRSAVRRQPLTCRAWSRATPTLARREPSRAIGRHLAALRRGVVGPGPPVPDALVGAGAKDRSRPGTRAPGCGAGLLVRGDQPPSTTPPPAPPF
jgi:hypothetical protein